MLACAHWHRAPMIHGEPPWHVSTAGLITDCGFHMHDTEIESSISDIEQP
jgi:hypothetical protein